MKTATFTGRYQCSRCLDTSRQGGLCACGGRRFPIFTTKHEGVWKEPSER